MAQELERAEQVHREVDRAGDGDAGLIWRELVSPVRRIRARSPWPGSVVVTRVRADGLPARAEPAAATRPEVGRADQQRALALRKVGRLGRLGRPGRLGRLGRLGRARVARSRISRRRFVRDRREAADDGQQRHQAFAAAGRGRRGLVQPAPAPLDLLHALAPVRGHLVGGVHHRGQRRIGAGRHGGPQALELGQQPLLAPARDVGQGRRLPVGDRTWAGRWQRFGAGHRISWFDHVHVAAHSFQGTSDPSVERRPGGRAVATDHSTPPENRGAIERFRYAPGCRHPSPGSPRRVTCGTRAIPRGPAEHGVERGGVPYASSSPQRRKAGR